MSHQLRSLLTRLHETTSNNKMSGVSDTEKSRGYRPHFTVQYRGSQRHRFGAEHRDEIRAMLEVNDTEPYPEDFNGEWSDFPRVARLRMNLTALSQHYNLYFVAYQGYVHVHHPNRTAATILEGSPLAILDPDESKTPMATYTSGHVNRRCPEEVNHMIVGDLGDKEILLLCRDNGDVVAWYTHEIVRLVEAQVLRPGDFATKPPPARPRHFFADNVGVSAWGLAIHTKSRLIAVSANTSEVTVFAFALDNTEDDGDEDEEEEEEESLFGRTKAIEPKDAAGIKEPEVPNGCERWLQEPELMTNALHEYSIERYVRRIRSKKSDYAAIEGLERKFQKRHRTWRIIIPLGVDASNLPSVSFCDDEKGDADRIAAIDINGHIFIADIWKIGTRPVKIPPHTVQDLKGRRYTQVSGWNILPITDAQLKTTKTLRAAIGMPTSKAVYRGKSPRGAWLDISKCMVELPNDAAHLGHRDRYNSFDPVDYSSDKDGIASTNSNSQLSVRMRLSPKVYRHQFDKNDNLDLGGDRPVRIAMTMIPVTGDHLPEFTCAQALVDFVAGEACTGRSMRMPKPLSLTDYRTGTNCKSEDQHLLRGVSFLRAYEEGAEIVSLEPKQDSCGVICHHVLTNVNLYRQRSYWDMQFGKRCSMLLTIPDLNLVILGSMCGRVALLTLTQPPRKDDTPKTHPRRAFRVEAVLPFEAEDKARERPYVCLLGVAVSPVPETSAQGLGLRKRMPSAYGGRRLRSEKLVDVETEAPKRWRLILNYMDHTILQYDIVKRQDDEDAEGLSVKKSRRRDNSPASSHDDRHDDKEEDFEYAYFSDSDPDNRPSKRNSRAGWVDGGQSTEDEEALGGEITTWNGMPDSESEEDDDDDGEDEEGDENTEVNELEDEYEDDD